MVSRVRYSENVQRLGLLAAIENPTLLRGSEFYCDMDCGWGSGIMDLNYVDQVGGRRNGTSRCEILSDER